MHLKSDMVCNRSELNVDAYASLAPRDPECTGGWTLTYETSVQTCWGKPMLYSTARPRSDEKLLTRFYRAKIGRCSGVSVIDVGQADTGIDCR